MPVNAHDAVFEALSDPTHGLLAPVAERGRATPTELARQLPVTRQAVSKHLAALAAAGLIAAEREGREVRYRPPAPLSMRSSGWRWSARNGTPAWRPCGGAWAARRRRG